MDRITYCQYLLFLVIGLVLYACSNAAELASTQPIPDEKPPDNRPIVYFKLEPEQLAHYVDEGDISDLPKTIVNIIIEVSGTLTEANQISGTVKTIDLRAKAGDDYNMFENIIFIGTGQEITGDANHYQLVQPVEIVHDNVYENDEDFLIELSGLGDEVRLLDIDGTIASTNSLFLTVVIRNDDVNLQYAINDTGINTCASQDSNLSIICGDILPTSFLTKQDAFYGKDSDPSNTDVDGAAGFNLTKVGSDGGDLPSNSGIWDCVRDNNTHLMWEVKTNTLDLRNRLFTYTWYNNSQVNTGGSAGIRSQESSCSDLSSCDTETYVDAINKLELCTFSDWRLPTASELMSIVNLNTSFPAIDINFFPYTAYIESAGDMTHIDYLTSTPSAVNNKAVATVDFSFGFLHIGTKNDSKTSPAYVRLVRDVTPIL